MTFIEWVLRPGGGDGGGEGGGLGGGGDGGGGVGCNTGPRLRRRLSQPNEKHIHTDSDKSIRRSVRRSGPVTGEHARSASEGRGVLAEGSEAGWGEVGSAAEQT